MVTQQRPKVRTLPASTAKLNENKVKEALRGHRFSDVSWVEETGSTNSDLLEASEYGERVLIADVQTAGRGRLGRRWQADPGTSLLMSVRERGEPSEPHRTQISLALALVEHCAAQGADVELKWPNDVMVGDEKLAGLLAEAVFEGSELRAVVVGMGTNVDWHGDGPAGSIDLASLGAPTDRAELAIDLLRRMSEHLRGSPQHRRDLYEQHCATIGRTVRVECADETIVGEARRIAADGALVVERSGDEVTVRVGDVVHLRNISDN